jgi:DNA-binding CsgD family transcriptional regulator
MVAETPQRRKHTARELAERFGVTPRTIQSFMAEPREQFEARSKARQMEALGLRERGLTYQAVADQLGISRGAAAGLVHRARQKVGVPLDG